MSQNPVLSKYIIIIVFCFVLFSCKNQSLRTVLKSVPSKDNLLIQEVKLGYAPDSSRVNSFTCEQGLFFSLFGNQIIGGVDFVPNTGSCLFVFKGEKKGDSYQIQSADYDDVQLKSCKLLYSIKGSILVDTLNKNVTIRLDKNPDACMRAYGVTLTESTSFDIIDKAPVPWKQMGIIRRNTVLNGAKNKEKITLSQFDIVKIISETSSSFIVSYYDNYSGKDIEGYVDKSNIFLVN
jgi:hypothetical protein